MELIICGRRVIFQGHHSCTEWNILASLFLGSRGWLPVRHRLSRENFHGFHKVIFLALDKIIEGRIAAETSRPPIPFAVGNLQAVVFCGTVHIACAFDLNEIAWVNLHVGSVCSQWVKSPPEIEKPRGFR